MYIPFLSANASLIASFIDPWFMQLLHYVVPHSFMSIINHLNLHSTTLVPSPSYQDKLPSFRDMFVSSITLSQCLFESSTITFFLLLFFTVHGHYHHFFSGCSTGSPSLLSLFCTSLLLSSVACAAPISTSSSCLFSSSRVGHLCSTISGQDVQLLNVTVGSWKHHLFRASGGCSVALSWLSRGHLCAVNSSLLQLKFRLT